MATFKAVTRKKRADGYFQVYIRIVHRSRMGYIRTEKIVSQAQISSKGEIKDAVVNQYCAGEILRYTEIINRNDISALSVAEVIELITRHDEELCFSDYARNFIKNMVNDGHERNAKNYQMALNHIERYLGTNKIMFSQLSSIVLNKWIQSMSTLRRSKEQYPTCLRTIYRAALVEYNDDERDIIRIKFNPWTKVRIPASDVPEQKAISAEDCREFFNRPLPKTKMLSSLPELGRDVAMLVMCLGGINTVDLYRMKKKNYRNGILCYNRSKTMNSRPDEAYFEMRVEPFIQAVFDKYLAPEDDEYLFTFHTRYCDFDSFCANANNGVKKICKDMGMNKEDYYSIYTFRHTWGTIAQNDCNANLFDVAFGMNHSHGMKVTRGYVRLDFTPAWELNAKVIDFIFFSDAKSKQSIAKEPTKKDAGQFRITPKKMVYGRAYFKGKLVAELSDVGFKNIDNVINSLIAKMKADIPNGSVVHFRIEDCDAKREMVYERTKGKGF